MSVTISVRKSEILLSIPVADQMLYGIPDFCQKLRKADTFGCSIRFLPEVLAKYRPNVSVDKLPDLSKRIYNHELQRREYSDEYKHGEYPEVDNASLWEHQRRGVALARVNSRYAFFYDTRTGKTRMAYQIISEAINEGKVDKAIVFVPSSIIPDWLSDAKEFPELTVAAYYKDAKTKEATKATKYNVLLMSTEIAVNSAAYIKQCDFNMCFFDESSKLKSHRTQISKYMVEYAKTVEYFYLLSATPAPNGYHEYYTQMRCIDPYIFPQARCHFVEKYFNNRSRNPNYEMLSIKPEKKKEFEALLEQYAIYVDQKVMPVAAKKFIAAQYTLDSSVRKLYDKMCREMSLEINGETITVDMATSIRNKLQQITSGFIINTDAVKHNQQVAYLHTGELVNTIEKIPEGSKKRLEAMKAVFAIHGYHEKYVIWANYRQEFTDIGDWLYSEGISFGVLNGETTTEQKEAIVESFKHGTTQVIICHPLSVGMGKNFTESHIAIYYSLTDSWEAFKQSSERIAGHINIQPHDCLYYILLAQDTIDELIWSNISNKRDQSYGLLKHLQSHSMSTI